MGTNLSISCPPKGLHDALRKEARLQGTSISRLAVGMLRNGLEQAHLKRHGPIGMRKGVGDAEEKQVESKMAGGGRRVG